MKALFELWSRSLPLWLFILAIAATSVGTLALGRALWKDDDNGAARTTADQGRGSLATETPSAATVKPSAENPYDAEYRKLAMLRGGLSLAYFEHVLGVPLFVTASHDGKFTQYLFRGDDYWVQAVADGVGAVQLMAVTSCNLNFHPRFAFYSDSRSPGVVLNETRFDQTGTPNTLRYFTGVTANSYYYDEHYDGNPGNYITYFVGFDDACPSVGADSGLPFFGEPGYEQRAYDSSDPVVARFRAAAVANTFAQTGPFFDESVLKAFQIGADRILTRTAPPIDVAPDATDPTPSVVAIGATGIAPVMVLTSTPETHITDAPAEAFSIAEWVGPAFGAVLEEGQVLRVTVRTPSLPTETDVLVDVFTHTANCPPGCNTQAMGARASTGPSASSCDAYGWGTDAACSIESWADSRITILLVVPLSVSGMEFCGLLASAGPRDGGHLYVDGIGCNGNR